jgi:hypothetical protein
LSKTSFDEFERPEQYNFIFICGLHRSGTSPFFRMLRDVADEFGRRNKCQYVFPVMWLGRLACSFAGPGNGIDVSDVGRLEPLRFVTTGASYSMLLPKPACFLLHSLTGSQFSFISSCR